MSDREAWDVFILSALLGEVHLRLGNRGISCWSSNFSEGFSCHSFLLYLGANNILIQNLYFPRCGRKSVSKKVRLTAWQVFCGRVNTMVRIQRTHLFWLGTMRYWFEDFWRFLYTHLRTFKKFFLWVHSYSSINTWDVLHVL